MVTAEAPALQIGERRIPFVLPSIRDARLHTAAVILTVHAIGITALGFRVSVPQILAAILAAALVDVTVTFRQTGTLVWPASGMLTGSGVALILRLTEMEAGRFWAVDGWWLYAAVAGISVATKHLVRFRGTHLFNPSNVGLVATFLLLGSTVVEPLDFWWAPLGPAMLAAYVVIAVGGVLITRRLALLEMAVVFWVVLAAGLGALVASGHCMTAAWSPEPVCGSDFWWVVVTSPEILVFQLFMITDPKTSPTGRAARIAYATTLGLVATLLIAPQATEYGAKVGLLGSLVLLSPIRGLFDRALPTAPAPSGRMPVAFGQGVVVGVGLAAVVAGIVLAGAPAREAPAAAISAPTEVNVEVDASALPEVSVEAGVRSLNLDVEPAELAVTLAENVALESQAIREGDGSLLAASGTGDRLAEMQRRVDDGITTGERVTSEYVFASLVLDVAETSEGQSSAALAFHATGTESTVTYDASGTELSRESGPFQGTFMLRQVGGERWLISEVR